MKKQLIFLFLAMFTSFSVFSQSTIVKQVKLIDKISIGIGGGLDYGGFGGNLLFYPQKNIGLFVGGGYALAGFGFNAGAKIRYIKDEQVSKFTPYFMGMYGYNAAIAVTDASEFNKLFYGPSLGIGIDYKSRPESNGYWTFALLVPIRNADVDIYIEDLKNNHGIEFKTELLPVAFSIAYRFIIN